MTFKIKVASCNYGRMLACSLLLYFKLTYTKKIKNSIQYQTQLKTSIRTILCALQFYIHLKNFIFRSYDSKNEELRPNVNLDPNRKKYTKNNLFIRYITNSQPEISKYILQILST